MANEDNDEKLIGKLIEKRKQENNAFVKLLGAIESQKTNPKASNSKKKNKK